MSRSLLAASLCILTLIPARAWTQDAAAPLGARAPVLSALQDSQWVRFTGTGISRHQGSF